MKLTVQEMRTIIQEVIAERTVITESTRKLAVLESRKERLNTLLAEKSSFLDRIGSKLGISNPSLDVDDPTHVTKTIDKALGVAQKIATGFQASAINSTKAINQFHDAVSGAMDKVMSLGDTLGPDAAAEYQKKMVDLVRNFYSLLKNEVERIETFQKQITNDLESKGLDKRTAYQNKSGLKNQGGKQKPEAPKGKPASQTIATNVADPATPSNKSFATNVPGPKEPSNKSFKTDVEDEE